MGRVWAYRLNDSGSTGSDLGADLAGEYETYIVNTWQGVENPASPSQLNLKHGNLTGRVLPFFRVSH